jgi:multidrug resistance efflux pump
MAGSIIVGALVEKAAEIRGRIATLEGEIAREKEALAHLQATLRMFDPRQDVRNVKPRRARLRRTSHFAQGEIISRCRDALRDAEAPVSAEDIARKALADKGLSPEDGKLRSDFITRILWGLQRMHATGKAEKIGHGLGVRWKTAA